MKKLRRGSLLAVVPLAGVLVLAPLAPAQQSPVAPVQPQPVAPPPPGMEEMIGSLAPQPASRSSFTFDRNMLQLAAGFLNDGEGPPMQLDSIRVENYHYQEPAFYVPQAMHALTAMLEATGWKHLVEQHPGPTTAPTMVPGAPPAATPPRRTLTDLWLHLTGMDIDNVLVLVRSPRQMNVIEVSGNLRPLDLIHLSGHFGIPRVDPNVVMVPAPSGK